MTRNFGDFVEIYHDALHRSVCEEIIKRFESSPHVEVGRTGSGVDLTKKSSDDITISRYQEWSNVVSHLLTALSPKLAEYANTYPALLTSALTPTVLHPIHRRPTAVSVDNYDECDRAYVREIIEKLYRPGEINIQRYRCGIGGYPFWHSEIYPDHASNESLSRVLAVSVLFE
jgi:hypothetical protein